MVLCKLFLRERAAWKCICHTLSTISISHQPPDTPGPAPFGDANAMLPGHCWDAGELDTYTLFTVPSKLAAHCDTVTNGSCGLPSTAAQQEGWRGIIFTFQRWDCTTQLWVWKERCQGNGRGNTKGSKTQLTQRLQFLQIHMLCGQKGG